MSIDDHFINQLPDNPLLSEQKIIDYYYRTLQVYSMTNDKTGMLDNLIE